MRKKKIRRQTKERRKNNSSVKDTMSKFLNISRIESESVNGYQVKYSVDKHEYQPFFGFSFGPTCAQLRFGQTAAPRLATHVRRHVRYPPMQSPTGANCAGTF